MRSEIFLLLATCLILVSGCSESHQDESTGEIIASPEAPIFSDIPCDANVERLIDDLCDLDMIAVGLHPTASATAFLAADDDARFSGGVLGSQAPTANPAMSRIVQLGVDAIPTLISHLGDKRPTKLTVGDQFPITTRWFDDEYDPRDRNEQKDSKPSNFLNNMLERGFSGKYVVKIGDVCFVLIGQIVNRNLLAVRYQPSGCMVVNSPIESPDLIVNIRRDWCNLTKQQHMESLMSDRDHANGAWDGKPALVRIRYYYPDALATIESEPLKKKIADIDAAEGK